MFQFRIRTLLTLTTVVAVMVWLLYVVPPAMGTLVLLGIYLAIPPVMLAGIIYHRGPRQAFFIGVAPWAGASWYWLVFDSDLLSLRSSVVWHEFPGLNLRLVQLLVVMFVSGLLAVGVRQWSVASAMQPPQGK